MDAEQTGTAGELGALASFFETLGFLVGNKDVDGKPVLIFLGPMTTTMWDRLRPWTLRWRKDFAPNLLVNSEWLANEVRRNQEQTQRILQQPESPA